MPPSLIKTWEARYAEVPETGGWLSADAIQRQHMLAEIHDLRAALLAADAQDSIDQLCGPAAFARNQAQQVVVPQARELSNELADERLAGMAAMAVWEDEP